MGLEPLSALFFSAVLLGEALGFLQWIGAGLILGGAAFGELMRDAPRQEEGRVRNEVAQENGL